MKIQKREQGKTLFVDLMEDISYENSMELESFILSNLSDGIGEVVLNIEKVAYVNSFALGILIKTMQNIEKKGRPFFLMNANAEIKKLLDITGILSKFKFYGKG
ncbi:MAG TPA: anti-sigma factor antagonist, partial [Spirochaetes bacterium]|nr:anti-sigma factor antagonist [Spirochaetota bacterium]